MNEIGRSPLIAVIGGGAMGSAVAKAVLRSGALAEATGVVMRLTTRSSRPAWAEADPRVEVLREVDRPDANRIAVDGADVVLLGVRPEHVAAVVTEIAPALSAGAVVVSLATAPGVEALEAMLPEGVGAVRAMSNLPTDIGQGVVGTVAGSRATREQVELVDALLAPAGFVIPVDEAQFDVISAVPGAGPAYVSYFIEALTRAVVAQGFDERLAERIVLATVRGAVARLDATGEDVEQVRRTMMHPGNITDTSMRKLDELGVPEAFEAAVSVGVARARRFNAGEV